MTVTEQLHSLGSWSLSLIDDTPRAVTDALDFFGHVAIWRGRVDVELTDDATLLASARYVGVLREKPNGPKSLQGSGMIYWLGDEDGKGAVLESPLVFNAATLTHCVTTLLPPAVTVGTIHDPGGTYSGTHQWQTPRAVLDTITAAFGVEYRVNGNGSVDVGTAAQLYGTTATTIVSARGNGNDFDLTSLGSTFDTDTAVIDYTSRVVVLGQKTDAAGTSTQFVEGTADAVTFPYKDLRGNPVKITRAVSDSGQTDASAPAAAQLQLNLYNREKRALTIHAADYDMSSAAVVGQDAYVFDPENGLFDPATQIDFRGELIFPMLIRIAALQWSITNGHTVAFRTGDGAWIDLTRWMVWDSGSDQITVGDLPRTLTSYSNPVLTQTQSAPDTSTPNPPTGLALTTTSVESTVGQSTATITASWTAPATNTDGSVLTDLSYYMVRYRWTDRAPLWSGSVLSATTTVDIPGLVVGLVYDVEVAAVDTTGHVSDYTPVATITAAPDQTAPNPPSDPVVTSYLGQLRIAWDGKDNTGAAMPPDFAIVEVHVSATSGFVPVAGPGSTTLVSELSTAGVAYATAPYGATRYVKLVAVDNSFNRSAPSGQASGATAQVADGDIASLSVGKLTAGTISADVTISGRIATALTGGRSEMNALGFQKFASDGVTKMIDFTGAQNLLTGTLQTALTGRRIVIGSAGNEGLIALYAPDGTTSFLGAYTESTGLEAVQIGVSIAGTTDGLWNRINYNNDGPGWANYRANRHEFMMGGPNSASGSDSSRAGFFHVLQTSDYGATSFDRLTVLSTSLNYYDGNNVGRFFVLQNQNYDLVYYDNTTVRLGCTGDRFDFYAANASGTAGFYGINNFGSSGSLTLRFATSTGHASSWKLWSDANGDYFEAKDWSESLWLGIRAGAFVNNSDMSSKTNIADYDGDALTQLRSARVRTYRRKGPPRARFRREKGHNGYDVTMFDGLDESYTPPDGPQEIGLVAQEAQATLPQVVRPAGDGSLGIDLYQLTTLTLAAVQQLATRIDALEKGGKP